MVHPIEHLRYVARDGGSDPAALAFEAADALCALGSDSRAVLTSCRRLLEFHPTCGPMWWATAQILGADSAYEGSSIVIDALHQDQTADQLDETVPIGAVVVSSLGSVITMGLANRPDVEMHVVGDPMVMRGSGRRLRSANGPTVIRFLPDEVDEALTDATLVLIEALAGGPQGVLVDNTSAHLARAARGRGIPVWAVAGVGRLLPAALFDALLARVPQPRCDADELEAIAVQDDFDEHADSLPVLLGGDELDVVVSARRSGTTGAILRSSRCPVPHELVVHVRLG